MLLSSLILLIACGGDDDSEETRPGDTSDTSGATDTGSSTDSGVDTSNDTADTGDDSGADTAVEARSPYANCIEEGTDSLGGSWTITYDADGNMVLVTYQTDSETGTTVYTWDDNGNQLSQEADWGDDGVIDYLYVYAYDDQGRRVLSEYTYASGDFTRIEMTYNADGSETRSRYDETGRREERTHTTYNEHGYPVDVATDNSGDDIPEQSSRYTYVYDSSWRALEQALDNGVDGIVDSLSTFAYDTEGRTLSRRDTTPPNPGFYQLNEWSYDAAGNVVQFHYEYYCGSGYGMVYRMEYTYDDAGRLLLSTTDNAPFGSIDRTLTSVYTCP